MQRTIIWQTGIDVSKELGSSTFRVEKYTRRGNRYAIYGFIRVMSEAFGTGLSKSDDFEILNV
jgi:hypothetical protein